MFESDTYESDPYEKVLHIIIILCVEELGSNVIKRGFSNNKPHSINIYLFFKNGVWTLRMRDDCESFNPKYLYELNMHEKSTRILATALQKISCKMIIIMYNKYVLQLQDEI